MLIQCPECAHKVSDKAVACPQCGYPIQATPAPVKTVKSRPRQFRRLPNGFGSIKHLSGNRRNPYAAYPATKERNKNDSPVARPAIGYFKTYNEAYQALAEYNKNGIEIENKLISFAKIYELFIEEYKQKKTSKSAINTYKTAYDKCSELYDKSFAELRKQDFQDIVDQYSHYSVSTINNLKILSNQMYKVAIENDIVDRNYAKNIVLGGKEIERGVPFTMDDIKNLWNHSEDDIAKIALIMIYSGYRAGELEHVEIKKDRFIGGLKTKKGRNRIVPIHPAIKNFLPILEGYKYTWLNEKFSDYVNDLGIGFAKTGEKHTPHDCRHTFSWLADKYGMDSIAKHMIMGHSLGKDVEANVYSHRTFEELKKEMLKIKAIKIATN